MAQELSPHKIHRMMALHFQGHTQSGIASRLRIHQSTVSLYVGNFTYTAEALGLEAAAKEYGIMNEMDREAIHLFAANEGVLLDPVYTGRAGAGLIDLVRNSFFKKGERVLFWHTGGTPGLFADRYLPHI